MQLAIVTADIVDQIKGQRRFFNVSQQLVHACFEAVAQLINPSSTYIDENVSARADFDLYLHMSKDTFENLLKTLDQLLEVIDFEDEYTKLYKFHLTALSARNLLFSSAAIRFAGSFSTN